MNRSIASTSSSTRSGVSLIKRSDRAGKGPPSARLSNTYLQDEATLAGMLRLLLFVVVAGLVVLVGLLANFSSTNYRVFATTNEGKLTALPPVQRELGDNVVLLWVMDVVNQATTMGFHDYQLRLQEIRPYFTDRGWESFNRYHRTSLDNLPNTRIMLDNDHLVMWPRVTRPPQISRKEVVGGIFTYEIRTEIMLNRNSDLTGTVPVPEIIDITVERVTPEVNASGLAISRWRASRR